MVQHMYWTVCRASNARLDKVLEFNSDIKVNS